MLLKLYIKKHKFVKIIGEEVRIYHENFKFKYFILSIKICAIIAFFWNYKSFFFNLTWIGILTQKLKIKLKFKQKKCVTNSKSLQA